MPVAIIRKVFTVNKKRCHVRIQILLKLEDPAALVPLDPHSHRNWVAATPYSFLAPPGPPPLPPPAWGHRTEHRSLCFKP